MSDLCGKSDRTAMPNEKYTNGWAFSFLGTDIRFSSSYGVNIWQAALLELA